MSDQKDKLLSEYNTNFSEAMIEARLNHWKTILENSIKSGWSADARKYFIGKRMMKEMHGWLFGTKNIVIWEHIIESKDPACIKACKELADVLNAL